jgi:hypothetical protein
VGPRARKDVESEEKYAYLYRESNSCCPATLLACVTVTDRHCHPDQWTFCENLWAFGFIKGEELRQAKLLNKDSAPWSYFKVNASQLSLRVTV